MAYSIEYAALCSKGLIRDKNQDNFWCNNVYLNSVNEGLPEILTGIINAADFPAFAVFDGMGGEQQGEMAAYIAAVNFDALIKQSNNPDIKAFLQSTCIELNQRICEYQTENYIRTMGTTAAILMCGADAVYVCNLGDSRIYQYSRKKLTQITHDHVESSLPGRKSPLTQCLGIPEEEFMIEPYIAKGVYKNHDHFLICSDGLTDMVTERQINDVFKKKMSVTETARTLMNMALSNGGVDNITVIVCKILKNWKLRFLFNSFQRFRAAAGLNQPPDDVNATIPGRPANVDEIEKPDKDGNPSPIQNEENSLKEAVKKTNEKGKQNKNAVLITGVICACVIALVAVALLFLGGNRVPSQPSTAPEQSPALASPEQSPVLPSPEQSPALTSPEPTTEGQSDDDMADTDDSQLDGTGIIDVLILPDIIENTSGNLANGGYAAYSNGRIYHCGTWEWVGGALYSENIDGSDKIVLSNDAASSINIVDDKIYYVVYNARDNEQGIVSINIDGTERKMIYSGYVGNLVATDNYLYFTTLDGIFSMNISNGNVRELSKDEAWSMNIIGDKIYYITWCFINDDNGEDGIYVMDTNGRNRTRLSSDEATQIIVVDDRIYYINWSENDTIYSMKTDGSDRVKISDERAMAINVVEDIIFFSKYDDEISLYKMSTGGEHQYKISDVYSFSIIVVTGRIFVNSWPDWVGLYTMRPDGSDVRFLD